MTEERPVDIMEGRWVVEVRDAELDRGDSHGLVRLAGIDPTWGP